MTSASGPSVGRDEGFAAWLAMSQHLVEDFLDNDIANMPEDPFSEEGLRLAEADALRRFDSPDQALALPNRELYDKYVRFIGEAIIRSLGGGWTNKPLHDDGKAYLGLSLPWRKEPLTIPTLFTAALARRTGEEWAFVYRNLRKRRDAGQR